MSVIKKCQEVTKVLNELSTAAVNARSEVEKLLVVLGGLEVVSSTRTVSVSDVQSKVDPATFGARAQRAFALDFCTSHLHTEMEARHCIGILLAPNKDGPVQFQLAADG